MAKTTFNGSSYKSKKAMLKQVSADILGEYDEPITLRQLYYRLVSVEAIENKRSEYTYLSDAIKEARLDGAIPFDAIEDRGRTTHAGDYETTKPDELVNGAISYLQNLPDHYHRKRWEGQDTYLEVWVEKQALSRLFKNVCDPLGVRVFPCVGYSSLTAIKNAAERFEDHDRRRKRVLYFGDFDPSGEDIQRYAQERLNELHTGPNVIQVNRIALTRDQIERYELPPQMAKTTDTRYEDFVEEHGDIAVELDAIEPPILRELIEGAVQEHFDPDVYEQVKQRQRADREEIEQMVQEQVNEIF